MYLCILCTIGYGIAGPSSANDDVEQEENADKADTNDESVQVHFPNDFAPGRLENVK